jgi:hypothetical protein
MRLDKEFKKVGFFWLPDKPDMKVPGTLSIEDGGKIEIEIVGHFDESPEILFNKDDIGRIVGILENNKLVTLEKCGYSNKNISLNGGMSKSKLYSSLALVGIAYDKNEEILFTSLSFSTDCFEEWTRINGIKIETPEPGQISINYNHPLPQKYSLEAGFSLELTFSSTVTPPSPSRKEAKLIQNSYFKITSNTPLGIDVFTSLAKKINTFICFATDETVSLKNVTAILPEELISRSESSFHPINLFYESLPFKKTSPERHWRQMLFTFKKIENNAERVINNWIKSYEIIAPAIHLYFSTKAGGHEYLEGKFLSLAQGLETYHRRTSQERNMPDNEYENLVLNIVKGCPDNHQEWLKGRLRHGNEINLRKRLKQIIEPFKDLLGTSTQIKTLIANIINTRNYLTHYDKNLENLSAKRIDLLLLCLKMEVIFQLHFLKVIGFESDEIEAIFSNNDVLKQKAEQQKSKSNSNNVKL